jgi:hypothetical protein
MAGRVAGMTSAKKNRNYMKMGFIMSANTNPQPEIMTSAPDFFKVSIMRSCSESGISCLYDFAASAGA